MAYTNKSIVLLEQNTVYILLTKPLAGDQPALPIGFWGLHLEVDNYGKPA